MVPNAIVLARDFFPKMHKGHTTLGYVIIWIRERFRKKDFVNFEFLFSGINSIDDHFIFVVSIHSNFFLN